MTLLLEHWRLLKQPLLYLSLFFKRHRSEYYRRLDRVRTGGDWEGWLDYLLDGVGTIADDAGVLEETTGKRRDRSYAYSDYLARLREGTELDER